MLSSRLGPTPEAKFLLSDSEMALSPIILKNTFFDVAPAEEALRPRRARSLPPALRRCSDDAVGDQLVRLNRIAIGDCEVVALPALLSSGANSSPPPPPPAGRDAEVARAPSADGGDECGAMAGIAAPADFSVGSWGHASGRCRPCAFVRAAAGCRAGAMCVFCHTSEGHAAPAAPRPCKAKRERLRKALKQIEARVSQDPEWLLSGGLKLPAALESDPPQRERALARLFHVVAEAFSRAAPLGLTAVRWRGVGESSMVGSGADGAVYMKVASSGGAMRQRSEPA